MPTPFSARIARNTQLFLIEESGTTRIIDPWGGSYYVERLTAELAARAQTHIDEIEALGGMARAIEQGVPKRRIEEAAARTQARIDSGRQTVIGVNTFPPTVERAINVLKVDAATVRSMQIEKLKRLRAERDEAKAQEALEALTNGARGNANLLQLSVEAARAKATVGEISLAMEKAFGRHVAKIRAISGVYLAEAGPASEANERVLAMTRAFVENAGHPPRILVAKMGQDGHDRGQKIIASAFSDLGFDVTIGPLFATPDEVAELAAKSKSEIVGVSSLAAGHLALTPALKSALGKVKLGDAMIVVGGVIPEQDFAPLRAAGADAIFPPGTVITEAAQSLIEQLERAAWLHPARARLTTSPAFWRSFPQWRRSRFASDPIYLYLYQTGTKSGLTPRHGSCHSLSGCGCEIGVRRFMSAQTSDIVDRAIDHARRLVAKGYNWPTARDRLAPDSRRPRNAYAGRSKPGPAAPLHRRRRFDVQKESRPEFTLLRRREARPA